MCSRPARSCLKNIKQITAAQMDRGISRKGVEIGGVSGGPPPPKEGSTDEPHQQGIDLNVRALNLSFLKLDRCDFFFKMNTKNIL